MTTLGLETDRSVLAQSWYYLTYPVAPFSVLLSFTLTASGNKDFRVSTSTLLGKFFTRRDRFFSSAAKSRALFSYKIGFKKTYGIEYQLFFSVFSAMFLFSSVILLSLE